jgi:hypothetical protein
MNEHYDFDRMKNTPYRDQPTDYVEWERPHPGPLFWRGLLIGSAIMTLFWLLIVLAIVQWL